MIHLEVLTQDHLKRIQLRADHAAYVRALGKWDAGVAPSLVRSGGIALVATEGVVACAGVSMFWEGVGQLWMRTGELAEQYPHALAKRAKNFVRSTEECLRLKRLQAVVLVENEVARRFICWLGFQAEGLLRNYGPEGADYIMFAKVRG